MNILRNILITTPASTNIGLLYLRLASGAMILRHGLQKVAAFQELSTTFFDPVGLGPKLSLIMIICAEVGASIFLMLGLLTRPAAFILAIGMSVAAFMAHHPFQLAESEMPFLYLLIFIFFLITGPGKYSADNYIFNRNPRQAQ